MAKVKSKTAKPVRPNKGLEVKYRSAIQKLIAEMQGSVEYWTKAAYRDEPPRMATLVDMAADAAPSKKMSKRLSVLSERWIDKFNEAAPKIAESYLREQFKASDSAFRRSLKEAGWSVEFKLTPAVRDAFEASLAENISLIKSIPEQYFKQVDGIVMRSYTAGRDLETMVKELKELYPKASDRAELIARDQSNKANAVVNRARQLELGITQAVWLHSSAGKHPRPSHVAANGKEYDIAQGCYIDGEYILPGQKINCRCVSRPVLPI
jgi:SPP1 gp7 family putative phage head morphogenesis protein